LIASNNLTKLTTKEISPPGQSHIQRPLFFIKITRKDAFASLEITTRCDVVTAAVVVTDAAATLTPPSSPSSPSFPSFSLRAIISDAAATRIAPSPNASARPTAAPPEDESELDGDDGSVDVVAI
jgi:hypothetical protein